MTCACEGCGQICLADDAWTIRGYCQDCRDADHQEHEVVRLFEPAPAQLAGQLSIDDRTDT